MSAKQSPITLRLYIAGITTDNQDTILNFKKLLTGKLGDNYTLEVIDILDQPELAADEKIIATPTLVRSLPVPVQKVIVDFSNQEKLLLGMDLVLQ